MILKMPLRLLEITLNTTLGLDQTMIAKLAQFEGKTLRLFVEPFQWGFFMQFSSQGVRLLSTYEGVADATIYSSPLGFIRLSLLPASKARSLFHDGVRLEGDVPFAQAVKTLMDSLDIDWEGHLARLTGDLVAYRLGACVRGISQKLKQVRDSTSHQLSVYLQEEVTLSPSAAVLRDFYDEVDRLVLDVARLEAKVKKGCIC